MTTAFIKQVSTSPTKSTYAIEQLELGDQDVTDRAENISHSRSVLHDVRISGNEQMPYLLKFHDPYMLDRDLSPHRIHPMQVETATANLFRLLAPQMCAKTHSVIDEEGIAAYCLIEKKPDFKTIEELIIKGPLNYDAQDLIKMSIVPLLTYHFLLENNDFRLGNMAIHDGKFFAFDFDRALWTYPTCALIREADITLVEGQTFDAPKFDLSLNDIQQFPNIKDAQPDQWPTRPTLGDDTLAENACDFSTALANLQNNPDFIQEKYYCFFKFAIIFNCQHLIENEVAKGISPYTEEFTLTVQHLKHRAEQLRFKLTQDSQFTVFSEAIDGWFQRIRQELPDEFGNQDIALNMSLNEFEALLAEQSYLSPEQSKQKAKHKQEQQEEIHQLKRHDSLSGLSTTSNEELRVRYKKDQTQYKETQIKFKKAQALGEKLQIVFQKNNQHVKELESLLLSKKELMHNTPPNKKVQSDLDLYAFSHALSKACRKEGPRQMKEMIAYTLRRQPKSKGRFFNLGQSQFRKDINKLLNSKEFKAFAHEFTKPTQRFTIKR